MSYLIFLGTAGGNAVSRQLRSSGGMILQVGELQFHLDPGPGALNKAKEYNINLNHTTGILVSHNHLNHCNDLNAVIEAMTHNGIEHRGVILSSKSVVQGDEKNSPALSKYHQTLVEKIIPLDKNHKVGIEHIEIHVLSAEHQDPTAVGFKIFCPKFTLSYPGDTKFNETLVEELKGTDILILNVPYPGCRAEGMNLDTEAAIKIVAAVQPKVVILTHFGLEMLKADPMEEAREVRRRTGIPTIAAKDGLLLSPESYTQSYNPVKGYE